MGGQAASAVVTLGERASRSLTWSRCLTGDQAEPVGPALAAAGARLPGQLRRSLPWDPGKEMAEHARGPVDTGVAVSLCDPGRPWQGGRNQHPNGRLRPYLPKGGDPGQLDQAALEAITAERKGRLDQPWASRHPHRHSRRPCPDPPRPPPFLRQPRLPRGVKRSGLWHRSRSAIWLGRPPLAFALRRHTQHRTSPAQRGSGARRRGTTQGSVWDRC